MSTNFYMKRLPTEEDQRTILDLAQAQEYAQLSRFVDSILEPIHLGKRSCGWKFLWNHNNGKYWSMTDPRTLEDFIYNKSYQIVDEYDQPYTAYEFMKMVEDWDKDPVNRFTDESYEKWERENGNPNYSIRCNERDAYYIHSMTGYRPVYNDITIYGIRYCVSSEFC